MAATQLLLIVLGLAAELVGIGLAVREVIQRRALVQEYRDRPHVGKGSGSSAWRSKARGEAPRMGDDPPIIEERLETVERDLEAVREEIERAESRALEQARKDAARVVEDARATARHEVQGVRQLLLQVTEPNWQVWASLGLLVLGVLLQSLASALGVVG